MKIHIKNLKLKTIVGVNDWEREQKQEVIINLEIEINGELATATDRIENTVNYKILTKKILQEIEEAQFFLLEKLAHRVMEICLEDKRVIKASVEVDKPFALRYADSVSVYCTGKKLDE